MTFLDRVQAARAEEQMRSIRMDEPVTHDGWSIKPTQYDGRRDGKGTGFGRTRCLACGAKTVRASSYCRIHYERVVRDGNPWDLDLYVITKAEKRRLSSGRRFGGPLVLASVSPGAGER